MTTTEGAQVLAELRLFRADIDARLDRQGEQIGRMGEQIAELREAEAERRGRESNAPPPGPQDGALSLSAAKWLDRWSPWNVILLVFALAVLAGSMSVADFRALLPVAPPAVEKAVEGNDDAAMLLDSTPVGPMP